MVPERGECHIEAVLLAGRDIDKHQGLAVPAQAGLQQVRLLGAPVRQLRYGTRELYKYKKHLKLIFWSSQLGRQVPANLFLVSEN